MKLESDKLVLSLGMCLGAAFIGSQFTTPALGDWYNLLNKPTFNPPNWVFAPVWTTLYLLMAIAFYLIWTKTLKKGRKSCPIQLFISQLGLNVLWSVVFFGLRNPAAGLAEIIALLVMIWATIRSFLPLSRTAAYLMIPYMMWVGFATILNLSIVLLN